MTTVYAESSAVLAWLLGESTQDTVRDALAQADAVVTSALTGIECGRGLRRARLGRRITMSQEASAIRLLDEALAGWHVMDLTDEIVAAARGTFPREPVRTLDALHLASAIVLQQALGALDVLSFDERVRANAATLQMTVVPAMPEGGGA